MGSQVLESPPKTLHTKTMQNFVQFPKNTLSCYPSFNFAALSSYITFLYPDFILRNTFHSLKLSSKFSFTDTPQKNAITPLCSHSNLNTPVQ